MPQKEPIMSGDVRKRQRNLRLMEGVLANSPLLRGTSPAQLAIVIQRCWVLHARRGEVIAPCDLRLPGAFVVAYGTVKLALRHADGEERVLRLVQAAQSFGESSALTGRAVPYEASALTECKLVVIPAIAINNLIDCDPRAARQIVHWIALQALALLDEIESTSMRRGAQRLASYLDSLVGPPAASSESPGGGPKSCTVRLPAAKTVIASRLDMKKETLSRLLRSLSERGLIEVAQRDITILNRAALAEVAA